MLFFLKIKKYYLSSLSVFLALQIYSSLLVFEGPVYALWSQSTKNHEFFFYVDVFIILFNHSHHILGSFIPFWNIALIYGLLLLLPLFLIWLNQRFAWLVILPCLLNSVCCKVASLSPFCHYYFGYCYDFTSKGLTISHTILLIYNIAFLFLFLIPKGYRPKKKHSTHFRQNNENNNYNKITR